jgi:radical SAM protein with 4Fe4S-binding SPASM domain
MSLFADIKSRILPPRVDFPAPGVYHYLRETPSERSRVHLRVDEDGSGTLIVNANRIFHFNPSAAAMAYFSLQQVQPSSVVTAMTRKYNLSRSHAAGDYLDFSSRLDQLITSEACPICDLEVETTAPFSARPSAPYRMDLAITYRCNNDCAHCYNARPRKYPELSTEEWIRILDQLWAIGIPHIVFTGGEPTLRNDLPELIRHAEQNGQITGLNTNGRRFRDAAYVQTLVDAGLDHVQITFESSDPMIHDQMVGKSGAWQQTVAGVQNAVSSSLYVMTNTTMLQTNVQTIPATLEYLGEMGLKTVGLNALIHSGRGRTVGTGLPEEDLPAILSQAQEITSRFDQRLIWYTPTQYCHFDPMELSLGVKGCTAALYNMCIEPDGEVIPCQSIYRGLGNIITSDWQSIWEHDLAVSLRERKLAPEKCGGCLLFGECGGGCPLLDADF